MWRVSLFLGDIDLNDLVDLVGGVVGQGAAFGDIETAGGPFAPPVLRTPSSFQWSGLGGGGVVGSTPSANIFCPLHILFDSRV